MRSKAVRLTVFARGRIAALILQVLEADGARLSKEIMKNAMK